ncbi:hypothetical protein Mapa_001910 [Marchantia paleacea]|nr:hypothetical protein Mapa_001910 [Marchantia paleacea]
MALRFGPSAPLSHCSGWWAKPCGLEFPLWREGFVCSPPSSCFLSPTSAILATPTIPSLSKLRRRSLQSSPLVLQLKEGCSRFYPCQLLVGSPQKGLFPRRRDVAATAAAGEKPHSAPKEVELSGAKPVPLLLSVSLGLLFRFLVPRPVSVTPQAWQLFAIFLATISGLVFAPLPVGAWAFMGLTVTVLTKTLPFAVAFHAFTNEVLWLIVISFFFARGFVKTGLGDRVATYFVKWFGKSTLGLSYGLTLAEALIAPAMPSTTARAGGIFLPIISSLAIQAGSKPRHKSSSKLGGFLIQCQVQAAGHSSALFLTGSAQNLLCLNLAKELGVIVANPWMTWFQAASVPAIFALLTTPLLMYQIYPPELKQIPNAPVMAQKKLEELGSVSRNEWIMLATMLLAVILWSLGDIIGVASGVAAMVALSVLLLTGVLKWNDCLAEKAAWDTLTWFAVLVGMASQLTQLGFIRYLTGIVQGMLFKYSLGWPATFGILQTAYFTSHYLFASQIGHVSALYSAIMAMQIAAGVPPVLAALALSFNTNLSGALTHYSSAKAAVYYGAGFVELSDVCRLGAVFAVKNLLVWAVVGMFWWKYIGLY